MKIEEYNFKIKKKTLHTLDVPTGKLAINNVTWF